MKHFVLFLLLALAGVPASAEAPPVSTQITKEAVVRAIAAFRRDPTSEIGRAAAAVIVRFAEGRPDVQIKISPKVAPWISDNTGANRGPTLLAAFVAGNLRSQLTTGVTKDDPVAGVEQVIETYRQLQLRDPKFRVPGVEKLIELQINGKLRAYLESPDPA